MEAETRNFILKRKSEGEEEVFEKDGRTTKVFWKSFPTPSKTLGQKKPQDSSTGSQQ